MKHRTFLVMSAIVIALVLLAAPVSAHGAVNAREVETLVLADEADDSFYVTGGYDIAQIFAGEAWIPPYGDGLYFHTILFGDFAAPASRHDEYRITFTVTTADGGSVSRSIWTRDGTAFDTDFDHLEMEREDGIEVSRAFIAYDGTPLAAGKAIASFEVQSYVDDEIRDRAPGGVYAPGTDGSVEVPMGESAQSVPDYPLVGPTKYADIEVSMATNGTYVANITSLLQEGDQHAHVEVPEWSFVPAAPGGWRFEILGENGGDLPAKKSMEVHFRLTPVPGDGGVVDPARLNMTTDIGGRVGVVAFPERGSVAFAKESEAPEGPGQVAVESTEPTPAPTAIMVLTALGLGVFLGRRRV